MVHWSAIPRLTETYSAFCCPASQLPVQLHRFVQGCTNAPGDTWQYYLYNKQLFDTSGLQKCRNCMHLLDCVWTVHSRPYPLRPCPERPAHIVSPYNDRSWAEGHRTCRCVKKVRRIADICSIVYIKLFNSLCWSLRWTPCQQNIVWRSFFNATSKTAVKKRDTGRISSTNKSVTFSIGIIWFLICALSFSQNLNKKANGKTDHTIRLFLWS